MNNLLLPVGEDTVKLQQKKIILIAHDGKVADLMRWSTFNRDLLAKCKLYASSPVVTALSQQLQLDAVDFSGGLLSVDHQDLKSNGRGNGKNHDRAFDLLVFFWDASEPISSKSDVEALLRLASVGNVPIAGNETAAYAMFPWCILSDE